MKYLLVAFLVIASYSATADWSPPPSPDPRQILQDAYEDYQNGDYEDALAKQLWFHNNALDHAPSLYGVRLSFALRNWQELAEAYPPALRALQQARDQAGDDIRNGSDYFFAFSDFKSINERLSEEDKTVRVFRWLDSNQSERAKRVYQLAQPTLIRAGEYELSGKYIDPENAYLRYTRQFRSGLEIARQSPARKLAEHFAYASFANKVSTLVALLVLSERNEEAEEVAEMALLEWDDERFATMLSSALNGQVPEPWP